MAPFALRVPLGDSFFTSLLAASFLTSYYVLGFLLRRLLFPFFAQLKELKPGASLPLSDSFFAPLFAFSDLTTGF